MKRLLAGRRLARLAGVSLAAMTTLAGAAGPDLAWPTGWTVFGPVPPDPGRPVPDRALLQVAAKALAGIPGALELGGKNYPGRPAALESGATLDLEALFEDVPRGATVFLAAPLDIGRLQTVRMGSGANWWMQWWLDGKPVYDTLAGGNRQQVISPLDHVFELALSPGKHVLAAAVVAGKTGCTLAVAGPRDAQPKSLPAASDTTGVAWPETWTAFGPGASISSVYQMPDPAKLVAGELLAAIPRELEIGGTSFAARPVRLENGRLDLATQLGVKQVGQPVYLLAPVTAAADTTVTIGAGAGGWMKWWLDGRPVYDTFYSGGNGPKHVTGTDHVFDLVLSRGAHVLAVAVVSLDMRKWELAVTSPREWLAQPSAFKTLMEAGRRQYAPAHWSFALNYPVAQGLFRRALAAASTEKEKAAAGLALADARLEDFTRQTDLASIRAEFETVLALGEVEPREQARALLGIGQTFLREKQYEKARAFFAKAGERWSDPDWAAEEQLAVAKSFLQERRLDDARRELGRVLTMKDLDPGEGLGWDAQARELLSRQGSLRGHSEGNVAWEARVLLEGIRLAEQVRPEHPRLFFNAETWPAVKARVLADTHEFQRLLQDVSTLNDVADRLADYTWGSRITIRIGGILHWFPDARTAALVHRLTGDPALLGHIGAMLRATVNAYGARRDLNAHFQTRLAFVTALDWVWEALPPDERQALAGDLLRYATSLYAESRLKGTLPWVVAYYEPNILFYAGLVLLGPDLDDVDYARAVAILGQGYAVNQKDLAIKLNIAGDDGAIGTPLDYIFSETCTRFWPFLHCWQSALSEPLDPAMANLLSPDYVLRNMLAVVPPRHIRHFGYARAWRRSSGMYAAWLPNHLTQYIHLFGKTRPGEASIAAFLRQRLAASGVTGEWDDTVPRYLLDFEAAPSASLPAGLPLARHYEGCGLILMSSGFGDADTYALCACGGNLSEADYDLTHFTIYKQGYLALDSGTRAHGEAGGNNYTHQTVAHNCVLIHMPGEELVELGGNPIRSNSGGQRTLSRAVKPLAFETDDTLFAYMATDATPTYHTNKCTEMVRQFLFLPPDHFVVFDRVVSKQAGFPKTWLLHTANEPQFAGREFRADQDRGRLYCRTLLPADAVLEPVGGPGREFWADGQNWPIPTDSPYAREIGMTNGVVPENVGRWRVEVKPGAARESDCFLHLLQATDLSVERMVESRLREDGDQVELSFSANGREYSVRLNKIGAVGGHIRIAEGDQVLADRALTREILPQSGLALAP